VAAGPPLDVHPEVAEALAGHRAVVALESTLVTHGLPHPANLDAARAAEAAVRAGGAVPATVALHDGRILVGLSDDQLAELAVARSVPKVTRQNLAGVLSAPGWAGTTVSATMIAARLAGIDVFATGGIGGVHPGGEGSMDVSADLEELARTSLVVVCAGPKSILDVPRTLEVLETRGVPVVAWQSNEVAGFLSRSSGRPAPLRAESAEEVAAIVVRQRELGLSAAVLVTVPLPEDLALPSAEVASAVERATREALATGIHGPATTPWILSRVAEMTDGRSVRANLALIENDAAVGARIALALAGSA
jgi:pseudouridine-5'-phosphate glycosidase